MSAIAPRVVEKDAAVQSVVYMIADEREREVHPFLDDAFQHHDYLIKQITIGDFAMMRKRSDRMAAQTLAIIERKTFTDFASGFKDGRYANLAKLLLLRAQTGCQVYFIIEGPAFPDPNRRFGRVPHANIEAAITKMQVRHGVMVIYTENQSHTARRLADFAAALDSEEPYVYPHDEKAATDLSAAETENLMTVPEGLTTRVESTDLDAAATAWARLRGVSVVLGCLLTSQFSFVELASGLVPRAAIDSLKTATGRQANRGARENLAAVAAGDPEAAAKVISGVRGVSPAMAAQMVKAAGGAKRLVSYSAAAMALIAITTKSRTSNLGPARAERVLKVLSYRRGDEEKKKAPAANGHAPSSAPKPAATGRKPVAKPASKPVAAALKPVAKPASKPGAVRRSAERLTALKPVSPALEPPEPPEETDESPWPDDAPRAPEPVYTLRDSEFDDLLDELC